MRLFTGSMRYSEAYLRAHLIPSTDNPDPDNVECPLCLFTLGGRKATLQPLHVDDMSGVHFLICPSCAEIFNRPDWYMTPEERVIRQLFDKIASLEARVAELERQPTPPVRRQPPHQEEGISLPNLFTV